MGLEIDKEVFDDGDRVRFAARLQDDLRALDRLLVRPGFGSGPVTVGAELELCIVDARGDALPLNRTLLAETSDPRLQLELDRFNLEYNLSPVPLAGAPFAALEAEAEQATAMLDHAASAHGGRVVQIGILPTLRPEDLESHAMTDLPRYRALSAEIKRLRPGGFQVSIDGLEPLTHSCDDLTLEGANTSLQVHLRVPPEQFAATFNAVQMATAPALAASGNSPIFLGHRLWDETRVALFKQMVDERADEKREWRQPSRVSFGRGWVRDGAYELFAESVALFPPLLPITGDENPLERLADGVLPRLEELRLQQGTVWCWNRPIYDPDCGGHLRIEMRALPAGPTAHDMMASAAFLIGLALGLRADMPALLHAFPFHCAEYNFYRAAQQGLDARLLWPAAGPPSPSEFRAVDLIRELLPVAERGLGAAGVGADEVARLLGTVRARTEADATGARWQRRALTAHERRGDRREALHAMLEDYLHEARTRRPVHEWGAPA